MIFSAEMDNAVKLGYKFEILWGYKFTPFSIIFNIKNIILKLYYTFIIFIKKYLNFEQF